MTRAGVNIVACVVFALACGLTGCSKAPEKAKGQQHAAESTERQAIEAAAVDRFQREVADLSAWIKERGRDLPADGAIQRMHLTGIETKLTNIDSKDLPDDLKRAFTEYVAVFRAHPVLGRFGKSREEVKKQIEAGPFERMQLIHAVGKGVGEHARKMKSARDQLRAVASKYGVNADGLY